MKIIAAPNSFKESLSAIEIAEIIADVLAGFLGFEVIKLPVGDGGDGTLDAVVFSAKGQFKKFKVHGPLMEEVEARIGIIGSHTAFIEMAEASGLKLVPGEKRNPLYTTTYGTGELILKAAELGVREIILGVGGSATVDGGIGALSALGFKFLDENGKEVPPNGEGLTRFKKIVVPESLPDVKIRIAVDVMNPLLGEKGAVRVYGPQKGLKPEYFDAFENGLVRLREEILKVTGRDINVEGAGAAGGIAGSFYGLLNASIESGIELVLQLVGFDGYLKDADLVITGEGKIDYQTKFGKAPFGVAKHAKNKGVPAVAIAGAVEDEEELLDYFDGLFSIVRGPVSLEVALKEARKNLRKTVLSLGKLMSVLVQQNTRKPED